MRRLIERIITERYVDEPDPDVSQQRDVLSDDDVDEPPPPSANTASDGRAGDDDRELDADGDDDDDEDCRVAAQIANTNQTRGAGGCTVALLRAFSNGG